MNRFGYFLSCEEHAPEQHVDPYAPFVEAGFDDVYVANMGPHYADMLDAYGSDVTPELRSKA